MAEEKSLSALTNMPSCKMQLSSQRSPATPSTLASVSIPKTQSYSTALPYLTGSSFMPPVLNGPGQNYNQYRQQTGIPKDAIASTLNINRLQNTYFYNNNNLGDITNFHTTPSNSNTFNPPDLNINFGDTNSISELGCSTKLPTELMNLETGGQSLSTAKTPANNVDPLWPGIHQKQAGLLTNEKHKQTTQLQRHNIVKSCHSRHTSRSKLKTAHMSKDPVVEEKITQLLKSMRNGSICSDDYTDITFNNYDPNNSSFRTENIDEDEKLLASEEGKKLSSKERRQLRNKVSARAFRSRRKEYINQLEDEIAVKVTENADLCALNQALIAENTRLTDITHSLLSSSSFSGFVESLSVDYANKQPSSTLQQQQQIEQHRSRLPKETDLHFNQIQIENSNIGMIYPPETRIDYSISDHLHEGNSYQPRVFSLLSLPEVFLDAESFTTKVNGRNDERIGFTQQIEHNLIPDIAPKKNTNLLNDNKISNPEIGLHDINHQVFESCKLNTLSRNELSINCFLSEITANNTNPNTNLTKANQLIFEIEACIKRLSKLSRYS
ncbi:Bgt-2981 [Blumeria graminis f. sp. tritici]|uniref:Bgt-2981 n=2 Tax=Blumeria graminis f. sp. tritici TaxID=62690 RepID=A0A061HG32_BLUGR|nr:hypothetical protein BGT96224_2981 [Blumeria graminis f. sp. tritici 96224]VDB94791.1 Bgt-2981 [Blumeria graminis f. sp. tritici]